jgi:hypothetical protein
MCGEPMPKGEEMFNYHGYSGPCPKEPLMQPHQARVVSEKKELEDKLTKLNAFIGGSIYSSLPQDERTRLARQAVIMKDYCDVLSERIASF